VDTNAVSAAAAQGAKVVLNVWPWGVLTAVVAFFCAMAIQRMAGGIALRPLWRGAPDHWTEKARLAYPGFVTLLLGQMFQATLWIMIVSAFPDQRGFGVVPLVGLAAFVGAGVASARIESRVRERPVSMLDWARAWAVQGVVFLGPCVVFCVLLFWLPEKFDWTLFRVVVAYVALVLLLSFGGTLALARWTGFLRPAPERLQAIVDLAVQRMGVERPFVCLLHWKAATALAFPFGRVVAVTDLALNSCTDEELTAICTHELAHLNEPRRMHYARLAGQFAWLPLFLLGPLRGALGSQAGLLVALGSLLVAHLLVRRMVLALEKRADLAGRAHEGEPGTYARALERLYQTNLMPAVTRARLPTHPHLYDRLLAAGVTPDYPRPKPPSRWRAGLAVAFLLLASVFCEFVWMSVVQAVQVPGRSARRAAQAARAAEQGVFNPSNPRVTVSWQIVKVVQPKAEDAAFIPTK
jgi:Zn-dependent protease with chaperone function